MILFGSHATGDPKARPGKRTRPGGGFRVTTPNYTPVHQFAIIADTDVHLCLAKGSVTGHNACCQSVREASDIAQFVGRQASESMGYAVDSPKAPYVSPVSGAVNYAHGQMEKLESLLGDLEVRLNPVLQNVPTPELGEACSATTGCELSDNIQNLGHRAKTAVGHVSELLARLGV